VNRGSPLAGELAGAALIAGKPAPTWHGSDLRKGRYSETGQIYLITAVTDKRLRVFDDFWCSRSLIHELRAVDALGWSMTWAFVVMPDHLHWLVGLEDGDLSRMVLRVKSRSAIAINQLRGQAGRLWQRGFHDHALRKEENLQTVARYVVANPVRAGLVKSVREYPHWDARWL
jgi:REP element-mobilizing transposase RayT